MKKRYALIKHLDSQLPRRGDIEKAKNDAGKIAEYLKNTYDAEKVYGVGSLFLPEREFTEKSDIDLVVKGLPSSRFFSIINEVNEMSNFEIELIPWEDANAFLRDQAEKEGKGGKNTVNKNSILLIRIKKEIEAEIQGIKRLLCEYNELPREEGIYLLRAKGSIFHDFYSAAERCLCGSKIS